MKGLNNDLLPEYVRLQRQVVAFLRTPTYANYFKALDKKLTKNTIKRCVVEPFSDKFMKSSVALSEGLPSEPLKAEIARFKDQPEVFQTLNETLLECDERALYSESQKFDL